MKSKINTNTNSSTWALETFFIGILALRGWILSSLWDVERSKFLLFWLKSLILKLTNILSSNDKGSLD